MDCGWFFGGCGKAGDQLKNTSTIKTNGKSSSEPSKIIHFPFQPPLNHRKSTLSRDTSNKIKQETLGQATKSRFCFLRSWPRKNRFPSPRIELDHPAGAYFAELLLRCSPSCFLASIFFKTNGCKKVFGACWRAGEGATVRGVFLFLFC